MKLSMICIALFGTACGASYPVPTQRMADAQSAHRSAKELGAEKQPDALLHLRLAEEQISKANAMIKSEENRRADFMLIRAKADAELALAIAHEQRSKSDAEAATKQATAQDTANAKQGVQP